MPQQKLLIKSGVTTEATETLAEGMWSRSNLIRWRDGYLEKQLGWARICDEPLSGVCRRLHGWQDLDNIRYIAAGTNTRLQIISLGQLTDITPLRSTDDVPPDFSTTSGSNLVTVVDTAHGGQTGDEVNIVVPVSVGGIILQGYYEMTVVDANTYTIRALAVATATVNNGGDVPAFATTNLSDLVEVTLADHGYLSGQNFPIEISTAVGGLTLLGNYLITSVIDADTFEISSITAASSDDTASENAGDARLEYLITAGPVSDEFVSGWGSGLYGEGTWGEGDGSTTFLVPMRVWSLDNFAVDLVACYNGGPIYTWTPPISTGGRATLLGGQSPLYNTQIFVAMPQLQIISLGAEVVGVQDPLLVRWCTTGDPLVWTASATNQAGSYRLSRGSRIVGGLQGSLSAYIWTDVDLWQMQYIGPPLIYSFTTISNGCGLVGPLAAATIDRNIWWMSLQGFYTFQGSVSPVPCAVWDTIFQDIDLSNINKVVAAASSTQREVAWYYPSREGGGEIDRYVKLNTVSGEWDFGELVRTAWIDQNVMGYPMGVDAAGLVQQHDKTYDADGAAMAGVMAETGFIDIADGTEMMFVDQIIPDFKLMGTDPTLNLFVRTLDWPFGTPVEHGPFPVNSTTKFITFQARARQVAFRIEMDGLDMWFRLGAVRVRNAPSGRVT